MTDRRRGLLTSPCLQVFTGFLRLGVTGFGGPLALVAQMQKDFVEKQGWIPLEEFQRVFTLIKSMPGAVAFNTAVYLGRRRAGYLGGFLAGVGLISPAFLLIVFFAANYARFHSHPMIGRALTGMQASALALILAALKPLLGPFAREMQFWLLVFFSALIFATRAVPEPALILGFGILWVYVRGAGKNGERWKHWLGGKHLLLGLSAVSVAGSPQVLARLFWICFRAGAFVFGTGIAIAPMLERDFVSEMGWVTHAEFMDALAIGQVTPGPVLLTTTFLGHKIAGLPGAFLATVGVFLAGFVHMMTWFPAAVTVLSKQTWVSDFLFGGLSVVAGTIFVTAFVLGREWMDQPVLYLMVLLGVYLAWKTKVPSWAIVVVGGVFGLAFL